MTSLSQRNKYGFTMVELLVVIAIIGLLSVLSVIALGSVRESARDQKRIGDMEKMQAVLELYFIGHNAYPVLEQPIELGSGDAACFGPEGFGPLGCPDAFIERIPSDPGKGTYIYISDEDGTGYAVRTELEGEVDGLTGVVAARPSGIGNAR